MAHFIEDESFIFQLRCGGDAFDHAFGRDFSGKDDAFCTEVFKKAYGIGVECAGFTAEMDMSAEALGFEIDQQTGIGDDKIIKAQALQAA